MNNVRALPLSSLRRQESSIPERSCIAREVPPALGVYWIPVFGDAETGMTPGEMAGAGFDRDH